MALSGYDLAAAYVMMKQHRQKEKVEEEQNTTNSSAIIGSPVKKSTGCCFCFSRSKRKSTSRIAGHHTQKEKSPTWDT